MNTILIPGVYRQYNADAPANSPPEAYNSVIFVFSARNTDVFQVWFSNNARTCYFRSHYTDRFISEWTVVFRW
jgi:transposase InsO family protein